MGHHGDHRASGAQPTLEGFVEGSPRAYRRDELVALYSRRALERAFREGRLVRLLPDAYVGARHARAVETRCDAVLLWSGDRAAVASTSAAFLHGLRVQEPRVVTVAIERSIHLRPPAWVRVLRWTVAPELVRLRGLRLVSVRDALIGAWCDLPEDEGTSLILDAVRLGRVTGPELQDRAADLPRIRSRRALERLLEELAGGAESYLEHEAIARVFNTRDFVGLVPQVEVAVGARHYRIDLYHSRARVAVELDGRAFHGDDAMRRRDLARDADLATLGILTIRLTFEDITLRAAWCRDRVRRAIAARTRARAA